MDTQMNTPMPRAPLTGVPSWIPDAQATRHDASHVTSPRNADVKPRALPVAATKPIR